MYYSKKSFIAYGKTYFVILLFIIPLTQNSRILMLPFKWNMWKILFKIDWKKQVNLMYNSNYFALHHKYVFEFGLISFFKDTHLLLAYLKYNPPYNLYSPYIYQMACSRECKYVEV